MSNKREKLEEGSFYHIYNRGNNRQKIFLENKNYEFFLSKLASYFPSAGVEILAYCLMPNHFHLLISPHQSVDFGSVMRSFSNSYVRSFNNMYRRTGHLFEDDYQPKCIESDEYLMHLIRYIHLNPVRARLVKTSAEWKHSDYSEWINKNRASAMKSKLCEGLFGSADGYKDFVMDYQDEQRVKNRLEAYLFG